jgi:ElaB/YqjD/DUF883 family membrane-anchored ribosome-binding protein
MKVSTRKRLFEGERKEGIKMKRTGQEGGFEDVPGSEGGGNWGQEYPQRYGAYEGGQHDSTFKQIKSTVADKLQSAAQTLHQKADRSGQPAELATFGHRAAGWLERSAEYVNEIEPQRLKSDIENQVRRNPGRSLLVAGIVGLALGGLLRRR